MLYDVFICHASEDKESLVRPLVRALRNAHLEVWYDENSIQLGQSLRESIDAGLAKSRYGVVVLSPAFFSKKWPQRELNGLVARHMRGEDQVILPIWHEVTVDDIIARSPPLADLRAARSADGLDSVCTEILSVVRPQGSPLIIARDELLAWGVTPPVITDEWWLDVVEASNRAPAAGARIPETTHWGRWSFPLPDGSANPEDRGLKLAWTAMQLRWVERADTERITQITPPNEVLSFISEMPGLRESCEDFPRYLACYAPQLTIPGFGGQFESLFDSEYEKRHDDELVFRTRPFLSIQPLGAASCFTDSPIFGPPTRTFETFDYTVWLHTSHCDWMPEQYKIMLRAGFLEKWRLGPPLYPRAAEHDVFKSVRDDSRLRKRILSGTSTSKLRKEIRFSLERMQVFGDDAEIECHLLEGGYLRAYVEGIKNPSRKRAT